MIYRSHNKSPVNKSNEDTHFIIQFELSEIYNKVSTPSFRIVRNVLVFSNTRTRVAHDEFRLRRV